MMQLSGDTREVLKNFSTIILVNNSPEISLNSFKSPQVIIINNPSNIGLSAALNIGIQTARNLSFKMSLCSTRIPKSPPILPKDASLHQQL